jgi:hypothetical protein
MQQTSLPLPGGKELINKKNRGFRSAIFFCFFAEFIVINPAYNHLLNSAESAAHSSSLLTGVHTLAG